MPVRVQANAGAMTLIRPTQSWKSMPVRVSDTDFRVDENFYVRPVRVIH
jgi:hypothetical protein